LLLSHILDDSRDAFALKPLGRCKSVPPVNKLSFGVQF
jgi:hypothetical protein